MEKMYYNAMLTILAWLNKNTLNNSLYRKLVRNNLYKELKVGLDYRDFDFWFDRMWNSCIANREISKSNGLDTFNTHVTIKLGIRLMRELSIKSMCGIQPMSTSICSIYVINRHRKDDGAYRIEINEVPAEAKTRKFKTQYMLEAAQYASDFHGIDVENEVCKQLDLEILEEFIKNVEDHAPQDKISFSGNIDKSDALKLVNYVEGAFSRKVNHVLWVSPFIADLLKNNDFILPETEYSETNGLNINHIGALNSKNPVTEVYSCTALESNQAIIGIKGPGDVDAGAIYCPFIPLMSSGPVMNLKTFQPVIPFLTRYYIHDDDRSREELLKATTDDYVGRYEYYRSLTIDIPEAK